MLWGYKKLDFSGGWINNSDIQVVMVSQSSHSEECQIVNIEFSSIPQDEHLLSACCCAQHSYRSTVLIIWIHIWKMDGVEKEINPFCMYKHKHKNCFGAFSESHILILLDILKSERLSKFGKNF